MKILWRVLLLIASVAPPKSKAQSNEPEMLSNYYESTSTNDALEESTASGAFEYISSSTEGYESFTPTVKFEPRRDNEQNATNPNCINMCLINNYAYFCDDEQYMVACITPYCEPEEFEHNYVIRTGVETRHLNRWKRTRVDQNGTLQDMCLLMNGMPLTRDCRLGKNGAQWELTDHWEPIACLRIFSEHTVTTKLNKLKEDVLVGRINLNDTHKRRKVSEEISSMFNREKTILPVDILLTAEIFGTLMEQPKDSSVAADLVSVCQEIMSCDRKVLRLSAKLNATNSLLSNFENYMDAISDQMVPIERCGIDVPNRTKTASAGVKTTDYSDIGVQALITANLSVFFANPRCDNITGIAIYSAQAQSRISSSGGFWYRFLRSTADLNNIKKETHLEAVTFLPENLWRLVEAKGVLHLIFKVYAHDALFVNSAFHFSKPSSKVISISIPELQDKLLPLPLPFLLRNENLHDSDVESVHWRTGCAFWDYQTWDYDGVITSSSSDLLRDSIIECHTKHLTQFTFLMGGNYQNDYRDIDMEPLVTPLPERILDMTSIVGCCLSLLGVFGIFLTATLFKQIYAKGTTKELLHLCLPMSLQIMLFLFHNMDDSVEQMAVAGDMNLCVVLGAGMHYIILVLFSWMLIIAFLQYQRFVIGVGFYKPTHYIRKAAIIAWSVPLIPTLIVAFSDPNSYVPSAVQLSRSSAFCYPSGQGLVFGVILPVTLITWANMCILVFVISKISKSTGFKSEQARKASEILTSIFMFFLLGLTWIFGVLAFIKEGIAFSYLFCFTATMQGFVLFVYFVLLDKAIREAWRGLLCPIKRKMNVTRPVAELQPLSSRQN